MDLTPSIPPVGLTRNDLDRQRGLRGVLARLWRKGAARGGLLLVAFFAGLALTADLLAPFAPDQRHTLQAPPSLRHPLGTDSHQYDVLTRVWYGARLSLLAAVLSVSMAVVAGVPAGVIAGYLGGWVDTLIMRGIDILLAFPSILLALLVVAAFRPGWEAVIAAVGLINIPVFARQVRATVLTVRNLDYVTASRALGSTTPEILRRAMLPAIVDPVVVLATLSMGTATLEVAGLSFLGIAGDPTVPEWGSMLAEARNYLGTSVWPALAPGAAISLTILGFNLLGDGLRDALDPRLD